MSMKGSTAGGGGSRPVREAALNNEELVADDLRQAQA